MSSTSPGSHRRMAPLPDQPSTALTPHFLCLSGMIGYMLSAASVVWSSYAASSIFATILQLSHQRFLVAYPVGLLYVALRASPS